MAMMGNWETVLQYQSDYANGFTIGSAQREQERYLDSIEGKWNTLKENLKNLLFLLIHKINFFPLYINTHLHQSNPL